MTRTQAIALITEKLTTLDDERVQAVADLVGSLDDEAQEESVLPRELTDEELALIEQSREDFRQGRTFSLDEAMAMIDDRLAELGVPRSK
jgi:hypothetical protein